MYTNSRKAGKIESFFISLTRIGLFNNFSSVINLEKALDYEEHKTLLVQTLQTVLKDYPLLLCNLFGDEISIVDELNFEDLVQFWYVNEKLEKSLSKLNNFRFEYNQRNKVLFKIFIINGTSIVFVFDHSIYDGMSSANFAKLFLTTLNSNVNSNIPHNDVDVLFRKNEGEAYRLPPPIEEMVDYIGPLDPPSVNGDAPSVWKSDKAYRGNDHVFKILQFTMEESFKIKQICKSHNVTMTPYIQSCFLVAQARVMKNKDTSLFNEITFGVDTRRYIKPDFKDEITTFGCNVSGHFLKLPSSESFNWDEVSRESASLKKSTTDKSILFGFGNYAVASGITDWDTMHAQHSIMNGVNKRGNLMVTNLGYHNFGKRDDDFFKLQRVFFVQSTFNLGFVFSTNVISDVNGMSLINSMVVNDEFTEAQFNLLNQEFRKILLDPR